MVLTRRRFLELGGMALAAAGGALWLSPRRALGAGGEQVPLLVVIFLRGGADGLHLVPPVGDRGYVRLRGALAVSKPLRFCDGFGLHPALAALEPIVARGELAAVHAVGSSDRSRSHFEAQDLMEVADPSGVESDAGWLARALADAASATLFGRLALSNALPLSLYGSGAFAIPDPARFGLDGASEEVHRVLAARYAAAGGDPLAAAGRLAFEALGEYRKRMSGAASDSFTVTLPGPRGGRGRRGDPPLPQRVQQLLALERSGLPLRAVTLECHGWDTHQRQGTDQGAMARPLQELGQGLALLAEGLRGRRDWLAVAMTEFGRTVRPNGSQGTDHGHGSALLVAGPRVRKGVHGRWPGLDEGSLHEGRDLAVANDYRQVLHEVLTAHLGAAPPPRTFPGLVAQPVGMLT